MYIDIAGLLPNTYIFSCGGCGALVCATEEEVLLMENNKDDFKIKVIPCVYCGEHCIIASEEGNIV